jgi:hypothetical protein
LLWPIKKAFIWACRKTGSLDGKGPTINMMNLTLVIVFISAFVTGILGMSITLNQRGVRLII